MPLPIRHGEGKIFTLDKKLLAAAGGRRVRGLPLCRSRRLVSPRKRFPANPNGSLNAIAGLYDPTGRIFGLMPHPEAYLYPENHPQWDTQVLDGTLPDQGMGLALFQNAVSALG